MKTWKLSLFCGHKYPDKIFTADDYNDACWKCGTAGFPPGYIWSITEVLS